MSETSIEKNILIEILNSLTSNTDLMNQNLKIISNKESEKELFLKKTFPNINFQQKEKDESFETKKLYTYFIKKIYKYFEKGKIIYFNSPYSVLYFKRIIDYLTNLVNSNIDIVEDDLIKIFFYLLFLYFDEKDKKSEKKKFELDETFFKGTFIELKEKYGSRLLYKDSKETENYIMIYKIMMTKRILSLVNETFQNIVDILRIKGKKNDDFITNMITDATDILLLYDTSKDISIGLINKIKKFYSEKKYLTFTNYFSENDYTKLKKSTKIDKIFLEEKEDVYSSANYNYDSINDITSTYNHEDNLNKYLENRNKYYTWMKYSLLNEIVKNDLNDEINIFAFAMLDSYGDFEIIQRFKKKLENLEQKTIIQFIEDILNDNNFYEQFFKILNSNIIKTFFTSHLLIGTKEEFQIQNEKSNDSENFSEAYSCFIKQYDKKNDNYTEFKKLLFLKILPSGDRAYTLRYLKKIVINPVQFFLGKEIKETIDIITILKGYLIVILLHEIEHFLRLLDDSENVSPLTPRDKEGGRMFIRYIFGVLSINHINLNQAKLILNNDTWNAHENLKKIFSGQLEDYDEENIDDFLHNYFKSSISFFSSRRKNVKLHGHSELDFHLRK